MIAFAIVCWQITGIRAFSAFNGPFEKHLHYRKSDNIHVKDKINSKTVRIGVDVLAGKMVTKELAAMI